MVRPDKPHLNAERSPLRGVALRLSPALYKPRRSGLAQMPLTLTPCEVFTKQRNVTYCELR